ncbi:hypothetical protein [Paenibacillus lautus]
MKKHSDENQRLRKLFIFLILHAGNVNLYVHPCHTFQHTLHYTTLEG